MSLSPGSTKTPNMPPHRDSVADAASPVRVGVRQRQVGFENAYKIGECSG
jgi:hypothetical protein